MTKLRPKEVRSLAYSESVRRRLVPFSDMLPRGFGRQWTDPGGLRAGGSRSLSSIALTSVVPHDDKMLAGRGEGRQSRADLVALARVQILSREAVRSASP